MTTVELGAAGSDSATLALEATDGLRAGHGLTTLNQVVLLHHDAAPSAKLVDMLAEHGLDSVVIRSGEDLPDPLSIRRGILLGARRFSDALEHGTLDAELEWLHGVDAAGGALLGVGHGARALAVAFGGGVEPAERPIRGWAMIDTLVPHRVPTGPWLSWQHDVITLPPGAVHLAHNRLRPQAFRVGRHLGVQFHPEATPETMVDWVTREDGPIDVPMLLSLIKRDPNAAAACARRLLSTFLRGNLVGDPAKA